MLPQGNHNYHNDTSSGQTEGLTPDLLPHQGIHEAALTAPAADTRSHQLLALHHGLSPGGLPPGYCIPRLPSSPPGVGQSGSEPEGLDKEETGPFPSSPYCQQASLNQAMCPRSGGTGVVGQHHV